MKFIKEYISVCRKKHLDEKTIKAYRIDLEQFSRYFAGRRISSISASELKEYILVLKNESKPKTAKRKYSSVKGFYQFMEERNIIQDNPFDKIHVKFQSMDAHPIVIPVDVIEILLTEMYRKQFNSVNLHQYRMAQRDIVIVELFFSTGILISELCMLKKTDVDIKNKLIYLHGKGAKERCIYIGNNNLIDKINKYQESFQDAINETGFFFVNNHYKAISEQSVRRMLKKYSTMAGIDLKITPRMFRNTVATTLLDADVDIRRVKAFLGHSSISSTEKYTTVVNFVETKDEINISGLHPKKNFVI